jgi:hypothetical protein
MRLRDIAHASGDDFDTRIGDADIAWTTIPAVANADPVADPIEARSLPKPNGFPVERELVAAPRGIAHCGTGRDRGPPT